MVESAFPVLMLQAFAHGLEKEAGVADAALKHLGRAGTRNAMQAGVGAGAGLGLGAGALVGGLASGRSSYEAQRAGGASRLGALGGSVGSALGGAVRGAGTGMLAGAAAGGALGAVAPMQAIRGTRALARADNTAGTLSRFGQRQVHGFTGFTPGGSLKSVERIGGGAAPARAALAATEANHAKAVAGHAATMERGRGALDAAEKAQGMGLTSLPGLAKSVKNNGLIPTLAAGAKEQWASSPTWQKGLMVGLPAASVVNSARKQDSGSAAGKGEQIGRTVGGTVGALAAPLPMGAGLALSSALERGGGALGKGIDRLRGHKPQVPQEAKRPLASEPGDTGQHAVEHVYGTGFGGSE